MAAHAPSDSGRLQQARERLIRHGVVPAGVRAPRVLEAVRQVPREAFVPERLVGFAYDDRPLPIGHGQTISQPSLVAMMLELANIAPDSRVLEVGTGSGYQTALLARLSDNVVSIEVVPALAEQARARLAAHGAAAVDIRVGDGHQGVPDRAPFDAIVVSAAPRVVPPALIAQLAAGGRLVIPVGPLDDQWLLAIERQADDAIVERRVTPVRFVPLV
jgi:protein-L-isoaspartate(D-aspartate) O-methyltransferase